MGRHRVAVSRAALRRLQVAQAGCEKVSLLRRKVQLDVDVDGCGQGKEVILDYASRSVGPDLRQVDDLECKFTGLGLECVGD